MKKFLKVLMIAVVLLMALPVTNALAYTGGLLQGKLLQVGSTQAFSEDGTTSLITDGDETTYQVVDKNGEQEFVWYEFTQAKRITEYQVKADASSFNIYFFDSSGNTLYSQSSSQLKVDGTKINVDVPGVKKVALKNNNSTYQKNVYEFDVFGTDSSDYANGLLDNVPYTVSADSLAGYPIAFDNQAVSNFVYVGAAAGGGIRIKFQKPINMTEYYLKAQTGVTGLMHLYDSSGALIQTQTLPVGSPYSAYVPLVVEGVSEIELTRVGSGRYGVIEFEVFGSSGSAIKHLPITNLQENHTDNTAYLSWDNPIGEGFIGTIIKKDGVEVANLASNITSYSFNGLAPKTNYNFEVIAKYSDSINSISKSISVLTDEVPPPEPVGEIIDLTATAKPERVNLSWELPESDELKHVNIYRDTLVETSLLDKVLGTRVAYAAETKIFETNGTYFNDLTVDPETTYEYTLTTTSTEGAESEGVTTEVTTLELEIVGGGYEKDPSGGFTYYWTEPTEGQVKVLVGGVLYKTVAAADKQILIPKQDMKYTGIGDPNVSLIPVSSGGEEGTPVKPPLNGEGSAGSIENVKIPFSINEVLKSTTGLILIVGPFVVLALAFLLVPPFRRLVMRAFGKKIEKKETMRRFAAGTDPTIAKEPKEQRERRERAERAEREQRIARGSTKEKPLVIADKVPRAAKEPRARRGKVERAGRQPRAQKERNTRERTPRTERG